MLSIFLALLVHFLAPVGHAAVAGPVTSPVHMHTMDTSGGPAT
jgi:hypothetical protein